MTDLLIHDGTVVTVNEEDQILRNGTIRVTDGTISAVGTTESGERESTAANVIDASGKVVIPGLIDAHRHTEFSFVQGLFSHRWPSWVLTDAQ
jgi:5-methylthioadenosine/S-adenosylhomocysteine deaminase